MDKVKHVFFDLDHTLWDFEKNSKAALSEMFLEFNLEAEGITFDSFLSTYRAINDRYWAQYRRNEVDKATLRTGRFIDAFAAFDVDIDLAYADAFASRYLALSPYKTNLFPNAIEVLAYLNQQYALHIITNGFEEVQYIKLKQSKLIQYFDVIVCSEHVGVKKPHPAIFEYALDQSSALASESVMIGDCLQADVQGAIDIGMSAVYFNPEQKEVSTDYLQIHDLLDLKKWL